MFEMQLFAQKMLKAIRIRTVRNFVGILWNPDIFIHIESIQQFIYIKVHENEKKHPVWLLEVEIIATCLYTKICLFPQYFPVARKQI